MKSMNINPRYNVVVGAGISGLSMTYELLKLKKNSILVEKEKFTGGLCRSEIINDCIVDLGSHVFYGINKEVLDKLKEIVPEDCWISVKRAGQLYVDGSYINWPFSIKSLFQLSWKNLIFIFIDLIKNKFSKKKIITNYDDVIKFIYGKILNKIFFKPLTEKFLKRSSEKISSDWAIASIRAATKIKDKDYLKTQDSYITKIDSSFNKENYSLIKFFLRTIFNRTKEPFYYFNDGYGTIAKNFEEKILIINGQINKETTVDKIYLFNDRIKSVIIKNKEIEVENLIWTGSIPALCKMINLDEPRISSMHSLFCYVFLKKKFKTKFDVCYFADPKIIFQRVSYNCLHSHKVINNNNIASFGCFEISFKTRLELENVDLNEIKKIIITQCLQIKMFDESDIYDIQFIKAANSYPVFELNYRDELQKFNNQISKIKNLYLLGRQGSFGYENIDLIINEVLNHKLIKTK
jgi:protoporphyrinogen oxidase